MFDSFNPAVATDWRAVCGKTACTVRWGVGGVIAPRLPNTLGPHLRAQRGVKCVWDARTIARTAGRETHTSAPSMAFNQPGESPGLGNVTAQYPKVVTA